MPSAVDICNAGLYRVGSSIRITSLNEATERTEAVRQAAFWYPLCRDQILQGAPWGFARKAVALADVSSANTFPGWSYVYQYPEDCLQAVAVCDSGGIRGNAIWCANGPWARQDVQYSGQKIPFQLGSAADGESNVIMTDIPSAYLYYIFRQTVTNTFTPLFVDALSWRLGAELGSAVQANQARVQSARQWIQPTLDRAMAQMMNEAQQDREADSPSIQVRGW